VCVGVWKEWGEQEEEGGREGQVRLPNLLQCYCLLLGTVPCEHSNFTVPVTLVFFFSFFSP